MLSVEFQSVFQHLCFHSVHSLPPMSPVFHNPACFYSRHSLLPPSPTVSVSLSTLLLKGYSMHITLSPFGTNVLSLVIISNYHCSSRSFAVLPAFPSPHPPMASFLPVTSALAIRRRDFCGL